MTLTIHSDLVQRSDEWYAARCGLVTASAVGKLVTPKTVQPANNPDSRRLTLTLAAERITEDKFGFKIGYSPDGLVGDDGLIEIKSRRPKTHLDTILAGQPPLECMAQLQCGLLVSGRDWIDYVSFCGGMPLWSCRITPDPKWFEAILRAAEGLERSIADILDKYSVSVLGLPMTERNLLQDMVI
jgi:hypothetical protein